jgi:Domain of unknown function (DUF5925)/ATPase family associated with various cellular activities (AAA)
MATSRPNDALRVPLESGQDLARARFLEQLAARALVHVGHDAFPAGVDAATAAALGEPVLVRASADGEELEAFVRTEAGALVYLDYGYGSLDLEVAAPALEIVAAELQRLRGALATPAPEEDEVPMRFWAAGRGRNREIAAEAWEDVRGNYAAGTKAGLEALMAVREPERGRLLLWHGAPGTGKTHALRALARAWRPWCHTHCILDPDELLGPDPSYLLKVLDWNHDDDRRRLLVLEDARPAANPQLLNVTDGLLGESARALVLITTNDPAAALDPALRRPGRCLAEVEFVPLSAAEASRWLGTELDRAHTLSELFARRDGVEDGPASRPAFGFGRAILSEALKPDLERVNS